MAPKSQPLPKAQDDTVLHAVILADPYGHTFGPVALGSRGTSDFEWGEVDTSKTKGKGKAVPWVSLSLPQLVLGSNLKMSVVPAAPGQCALAGLDARSSRFVECTKSVCHG